jgi:microcystin-dependent protein
MTTFALPQLQRAVGADATHPLGTQFGDEERTLTAANLPAHDHQLLGGGVTELTGGGQPFNNDQPSLAVNYLIAVSGIFPSRDGESPGFDTDLPILGQVVEFAGTLHGADGLLRTANSCR